MMVDEQGETSPATSPPNAKGTTMTSRTENRAVTMNREAVCKIEAPKPDGIWNPLPHKRVLEITEDAIRSAGFAVTGSNYQVSHGGHRMFGNYFLDRVFGPNDGARLMVGCRNSTDKEFAMAFAAGESILVCSNGCFFGDLVVSRKHTGDCDREFASRIAERIATLPQVVADATERIEYLRNERVNESKVHDLICRGVKADVFAPSEAFKVLDEYDNPSFEDQGTGTLWGVHNAATHVFKTRAERNPLDFQQRTVRLQGLLLPEDLRAKAQRQFDVAV